jgi:predicted MFS family arabinose efflux permease
VLIALALAQLLSALTTGVWALAAWRSVSGTAAGLAYAMGLSSIASSRNPDRGFALYFGAMFVAGLIALVSIPALLQWNGFRGFYLTYAAAVALCVVLMCRYPVHPGDSPVEVANGQSPRGNDPRGHAWLLAGLFLNFVFNGGIWVLAEHFGLQIKGTNAESIGALLAGTMLFALAGTGIATLVAQRWSHLMSIVVGNLGLVLSVCIMTQWRTVAGLMIAMALLNMAVTILTPATLSALAMKSSNGAQWGNLASQAGYSVGPAAAAAITAESSMSGLAMFSVIGFLISIVFSWLAFARSPAMGREQPGSQVSEK